MSVEADLQAVLAPLNAGRHNAALKAAKKAMGRHGSQAIFPNIAGIALCAMNRQREGVTHFRKALKLDPNFHDARKNLAQTYIVLGETEAAAQLLDRLTAATPKDAGAWYLLAQARSKTGQPEAALDAADTAIRLNPRDARNFNLRGVLRGQLGRPAEALADFEEALRIDPDHVETLVNIAMPLARQTRVDEARAALEHALRVSPDHTGARQELASFLLEAGEMEAARREYLRLLDQSPGHVEALNQLARIGNDDERTRAEADIRRALKKSPRSGVAFGTLSMALAELAARAGDQDEFADRLAQANAAFAAALPFDGRVHDDLTDRILGYFPDPVPPVETGGPDVPYPIYVTGLPRSGTTLTEAMLGAHSAVKPLGERGEAGFLLYPLIESGAAFDAAAIEAFVQADRKALPALPQGTRAYTDKLPDNYRLIGFLKTAYPSARIIQMRRDPRDIGLSMWRAHFSGTDLAYCHDQRKMAAQFNRYARMMAHWHRVFPGQILEFSYEDLVADALGASKRLAEFCELDWQPGMARPDLSADHVLTLSASQLRQPVHSRSVGRWRDHAGMLATFLEGLDPVLWPDYLDAS